MRFQVGRWFNTLKFPHFFTWDHQWVFWSWRLENEVLALWKGTHFDFSNLSWLKILLSFGSPTAKTWVTLRSHNYCLRFLNLDKFLIILVIFLKQSPSWRLLLRICLRFLIQKNSFWIWCCFLWFWWSSLNNRATWRPMLTWFRYWIILHF